MTATEAARRRWVRQAPAILAAIVFNAVPLIGVVFWGWSPFTLVLVYWLENLIVGVRTLIEMALCALLGRETNLFGLIFFCGFFAIHYGIFCAGHGLFIVVLFSDGAYADIGQAVAGVLATTPGVLLGLASMAGWQLVELIRFVMRGEARSTTPLEQMFAPYGRIVLLHVAILGGGFLSMMLAVPAAGLVALVAFKTLFDIGDVLGMAPQFDRRPNAPWRQRRRELDGDPLG